MAVLPDLKLSIPLSAFPAGNQADLCATWPFAEPLAVAIHAAHEAGDLQGKRVFTPASWALSAARLLAR